LQNLGRRRLTIAKSDMGNDMPRPEPQRPPPLSPSPTSHHHLQQSHMAAACFLPGTVSPPHQKKRFGAGWHLPWSGNGGGCVGKAGDSVEIMHVPAASPNWDKGKCSGSAPAQLGVCTSKMANLYGRWWVWARSPGVSPVRLGKRLSGDGGCLSGPLPPPDVQGGRVG